MGTCSARPGNTEYGNSPSGTGRGLRSASLRKYTRAVRVSLKLHAREAYASSALVLAEKQFAPIGYIKLNCVTYLEYCKNMLYGSRWEY